MLLHIHTRWESFGFVAREPESGQQSNHCAGARAAAEELAEKLAGKTARLQRIARGHYAIQAPTPKLRGATERNPMTDETPRPTAQPSERPSPAPCSAFRILGPDDIIQAGDEWLPDGPGAGWCRVQQSVGRTVKQQLARDSNYCRKFRRAISPNSPAERRGPQTP